MLDGYVKEGPSRYKTYVSIFFSSYNIIFHVHSKRKDKTADIPNMFSNILYIKLFIRIFCHFQGNVLMVILVINSVTIYMMECTNVIVLKDMIYRKMDIVVKVTDFFFNFNFSGKALD